MAHIVFFQKETEGTGIEKFHLMKVKEAAPLVLFFFFFLMKVKDLAVIAHGMNSTVYLLILVNLNFLFEIDFAQKFQLFEFHYVQCFR